MSRLVTAFTNPRLANPLKRLQNTHKNHPTTRHTSVKSFSYQSTNHTPKYARKTYSSSALSSQAPPDSAGVATGSPTTPATTPTLKMEDIVSLCKRRGFIFQSSDLYGGYGGFYDYGHLGVEVKKNIKDHWWNVFVRGRDDIVGLDSSIIGNPKVWESSGHVGGFSDPMVDCKETKLRFRADQVFWSPVIVGDETVGYVSVHEDTDDKMVKEGKKMAKKILKERDMKGMPYGDFDFKDLTFATESEMSQIPSPASGKATLTMPRDFNLMFSTSVGANTDTSSLSYLRPETAQGIFVNFKNIQGPARMKVPFGIAQIGKAFRNEITPRNFIFRSREFEQMEIEYFIKPGEGWKEEHEKWLKDSKSFLLSLGLREDLMGWDVHTGDGLAHYANACTDVTFSFPFGVSELMGIAARGDYDLKAHTEGSGKSMEYFDEVTKEKYIPHVIEPSLGVDRVFLAIMCSAYAEDSVGGEKRNFLKFHPRIAPVKAAVLPLVKNKPELVKAAKELYDGIKMRWNVEFDAGGAIGRRYRRQDEIGTPFCITVDFDTIEKEEKEVTIRFRDTTEQIKMHIDEVPAFLSKEIDFS
eukprot:CAMPEP_0118665236 /NCGR_PEP_ID=MMETSP0785-20121206/18507_1 /TAXON_ID=91992 /ORGANISM="Bolidomonas pacifica, Strain CCMP 1866" /LENGTH=582 /DNA_ID=CAMNT_0006559333 /DNA_START=21 /DNA_END=1769 /DNA_ORIENTATION=+